MSVRSLRAALVAASIACAPALPEAVFAQDGGGATPADSAAAAGRKRIDSSGAITVYQEAFPGEGIEGFYWTFDPRAELDRLLDKDRRDQPLEPIRDAFGFELMVPDTIRALRDSVRVVADSILAVTIEVGRGFDPRYRSSYIEQKDDFQLNHDFDTSYLLSRAASLSLVVGDQNAFNASTHKQRDDRTVTTALNYRFSERINSSLSIGRSDNRQQRVATEPGEADVLESDADNTSADLRFQGSRPANVVAGVLVGDLNFGLGMSANRRNYQSATVLGKTEQISPNWNLKLARSHRRGKSSFDYTGDLGRARSQEESLVDSIAVATLPTRDFNFNNRFNGSVEQDFAWTTKVRLNGGLSRNRFQYLSQADTLRGLQETRQQSGSSLNATVDSKPTSRISIKGAADYSKSETKYDLERRRFSQTISKGADAEVAYDAWTGAKITVQVERSLEDRNYLTNQAGRVANRRASIGYTQKLMKNVNFEAGYFVKLDSFLFDAFDENKGDRDLLLERTNFKINYAPFTSLTTGLRMETRKSESVNIHPDKSPDNKTDEAFIIEPSYTLRLGQANIQGDFTADATYSVFDFKEASNFLLRRFATRQKWQQAITPRLSTEFIVTYDLSDEGSYVRKGEGSRVFAKSRETRRHKESLDLRYSPRPWLRANVLYRQESDDQFSIRSVTRQKDRTSERDIYELSGGVNVKKRLTKHVLLDLNYSLTSKRGDRISEVERKFYNVRASIEYQPFKKKSDEGSEGGL